MNELEKYHDQVLGQEVVNFQMPREPESAGTSHLLAGILRRWYVVLLVLVVLCAAGLPAIWFLLGPEYEVTGAIRIAPIMADILSGESDTGEISVYASFMNTQAELITSNRVVQRVADDLADADLSFFNAQKDDFISRLKAQEQTAQK